MRIASFNINGIKARLPRLLEWLEETRPDIACLQELKTSDETFPIKDIEAAGYGAIWHGQKGLTASPSSRAAIPLSKCGVVSTAKSRMSIAVIWRRM